MPFSNNIVHNGNLQWWSKDICVLLLKVFEAEDRGKEICMLLLEVSEARKN